MQARGMIYKVVAYTVLLYGSEMWVATGAMLKVLEGLHHGADHWIKGMTTQGAEDGEWEYPLVADAMEI